LLAVVERPDKVAVVVEPVVCWFRRVEVSPLAVTQLLSEPVEPDRRITTQTAQTELILLLILLRQLVVVTEARQAQPHQAHQVVQAVVLHTLVELLERLHKAIQVVRQVMDLTEEPALTLEHREPVPVVVLVERAQTDQQQRVEMAE